MDTNLNKIIKMYDKLNYFDQYGGSLVLFIIITLIIVILISYFQTMINIQPIVDDWPNQRCKPNIMPLAGFITHPEGVSATEYTYQNFNYCIQNILSSITGDAVKPITYLTDFLKSLADKIQNSIQSIRAMFDKIRTNFQEVSQEIMGRLMNVMIPLMQIIISFRDLIGKIQGTMTASVYTAIGGYYTLQSLMGAIAQFIIMILIALATMIAIFWILPFTWGVAAANTVIFIAIAIPMSIILAFMADVLKVTPSLKIPSVKCFDKNTLLKMNDGTLKKIQYIETGDILLNNNIVTSKIKVTTEGSIMYLLNNVLVSDSHIVNYNGKWISVSNHPKAIKIDDYNEPYLYCLNTTNKIIEINDLLFTDWDEIYDDTLNYILKNCLNTKNKDLIHKYLDNGFAKSTQVKMKNNVLVNIDKIKINDILENGEKVYGIVEIDGSSLAHQFKYNLGENNFVEGYLQSEIIKNKHKKLYHILTNNKTFKIKNTIFQDYNAVIERHLENN
jgi:hypothetical protein